MLALRTATRRRSPNSGSAQSMSRTANSDRALSAHGAQVCKIQRRVRRVGRAAVCRTLAGTAERDRWAPVVAIPRYRVGGRPREPAALCAARRVASYVAPSRRPCSTSSRPGSGWSHAQDAHDRQGFRLRDLRRLTRFVGDARVPLDNNATERGIRGLVVGRRNHFGSKSRRGTEVAAVLYSLIETAKLNGVDPAKYLAEATRAARHGEMLLPGQLTA